LGLLGLRPEYRRRFGRDCSQTGGSATRSDISES